MRSLAVTLACVVLAGCSFFPRRPGYALDCGQMPRSECEKYAAGIVAYAQRQHPQVRVVSLVITAPNGSYDLLYADGTGLSAIVDDMS